MTAVGGQRQTLAARTEALLARHWWRARPSRLSRLLMPLAWLYGALAQSARKAAQKPPANRENVPTLVVGNIIAGGAGKTPTVIALVQAFQRAGRRPGVISRGHGRSGDGVLEVTSASVAAEVGDEPLLIARRTGVPVFVGRDRSAAAQALCRLHPAVDVLLSDDGLQHHALARDAELLVFDDRGIGNGLLLPAGPLREPLPLQLRANQRVLYTGTRASTALAGRIATRALERAWPLQAWQRGEELRSVPLADLQGRPLLAVAGLAVPERFFAMLEWQSLSIDRLPLPDHHAYERLPWPSGIGGIPDVVTTEKDAVKLLALDTDMTNVWVLPLDFALPEGMADELLALLPLTPALMPQHAPSRPPPP